MKHLQEDPVLLATRLAEKYDLPLPGDALQKLVRYSELLLGWNEKHNLISRADTANIWRRHILHSLLPVLLSRIPQGLKFVDIGSGGGLPGIPIAIVRPDLTGVLVDSIRKKTETIVAMTSDLGIRNVSVVNARVEGPEFLSRFERSFDIVFARGVAELPQLVQWSMKLLKKGTHIRNGETGGKVLIAPPAIVSFKGGDVRDEVERTRKLYPSVAVDEHAVDIEGIADESFSEKKLIIVSLNA